MKPLFKIGDRVRSTYLVSEVGVIVGIRPGGSELRYAIHHDQPKTYYHDCKGLCPMGYGFYRYESNLVKLSLREQLDELWSNVL